MKEISPSSNRPYRRKWWIEGLAAAAVLFVAAVVFTWPLGQHLTESIPAGCEPPTICMFHLFMAQWTGMALDKGESYWNAPYFYPHRGVFAWSEPSPFSSALIWLIAKLTGYILAYNIVILVYMACFGLSGYCLARLLTEDRVAALWSGVWLTGGAYLLQRLCALNLVATAFPAGCLFFSFLFAGKGQMRFLWAAFIFYVLTWASCGQYGFFLTILLPVALVPFLSLNRRRWPVVISCLLAAAAALAFVLPFVLRQLSYLQDMGFERRLTDVRGVFRLDNLFMPAKGHWLATHILGWGNKPGYRSLDVGVVPLTVIILSVCLGVNKLRTLNTYQKRIRAGLVAMAAAALILGFGPGMGAVINGRNFSLYSFLFSNVPGLNVIRSPARLGMFVTLGVAVFSAPALAYVRSRMKTAGKKRMVTIALFGFLFAEMWTMPVVLAYPHQGIRGHSKVINWLGEYGAGQPVLELPIPGGLRVVDTEPEAWAMYRMLRHKNPIINGYSAYFPVPFRQLKMAVNVDPAGRGRRYIDAYGARYVLVHNHKLSCEQSEGLQKALGDTAVYNDDKHTIYLLPERGHIQDAEKFLPVTAEFRQKIPREGKIYGLPLPKPIDTTILITPQPDLWVGFNWRDESGQARTKKVRILGSVLLDVEHPRLYVRLLRFPQGDRNGEARFISAEKVATISQPQRARR